MEEQHFVSVDSCCPWKEILSTAPAHILDIKAEFKSYISIPREYISQ